MYSPAGISAASAALRPIPPLETVVLYAGQVATYVCVAGELQPMLPVCRTITAELLASLGALGPVAVPIISSTGCGGAVSTDDAQAGGADAATASAMARSSNRTTAAAAAAAARHQLAELATSLRGLLSGREVVLIVPLLSTPEYLEQLLQFLFHASVGARSAIVVSDVIADTIACGVPDGAVLHGSITHVTIGRVKEGAAARYASARAGAPQQLLLLAGGRQVQKGSISSHLATPVGLMETLALMDLREDKYRADLIAAFGFQAYVHVMEASAAGSSPGSGKGRGAQREAEWKSGYSKHDRAAPGAIEKLLARVVKGGGPLPTIIAGEALHVPLYAELLAFIVGRCGEGSLVAAEAESRAKELERAAASVARKREREDDGEEIPAEEDVRRQRGHEQRHGQQQPRAEGSPVAKKRLAEVVNADASSTCSESSEFEHEEVEEEDEDDEEATDSDDTGSNSDTSSSGDSSVTDTSSVSSESQGLHIVELPLPEVPWWLPLLGGGIVSALSYADTRRMRITAAEVASSKGAIVHWKAML